MTNCPKGIEKNGSADVQRAFEYDPKSVEEYQKALIEKFLPKFAETNMNADSHLILKIIRQGSLLYLKK